jgi:NADH dehydrogenase FAD-containing subunit
MIGEAAGAELDRAGRVAVGPHCALPGHPEVFAIGDMVAMDGVPGVAQPAIQEGRYVAEVIESRRAGWQAPPPFKYFDKGSLARNRRERLIGTPDRGVPPPESGYRLAAVEGRPVGSRLQRLGPCRRER